MSVLILWNHPWLGVLTELSAMRGMLWGVLAMQRRFDPSPEVARKTMHAVTGIIMASSAWLFHNWWPAAVVATVLAALLMARLRVPSLHEHVSQLMYAINRHSIGEFYYAAAFGLIFYLANGSATLFCVPILILAIADAAAAIVGVRLGAHRYRSPGGSKSVEGSVAFCAAAFMITFAGLLAANHISSAMALLIALNAAVLLMMVEALSFGGLDNLLVPLAAWGLLKTMTAAQPYEVEVMSCGTISLIMGAALHTRRRGIAKASVRGDSAPRIFRGVGEAAPAASVADSAAAC